MKKYIILSAIMALLLGSSVASAEVGAKLENRLEAQVEKKSGQMNERKELLKDARADAKGELRMNKEEFKEDWKEMRDAWKRTATFTKSELKIHLDDLKQDMKDRRAAIKARLASSTTDIKARFDKDHKDRIEGRIANVEGKFDAAISRLEAFDEKVEAAIQRFKDKNIDTSNAESLLIHARAELEDARDARAEFHTNVQAMLNGDGEVSRVELKTEAEVVMEAIRSTHAAYVDVVVELKASDNDDNDSN